MKNRIDISRNIFVSINKVKLLIYEISIHDGKENSIFIIGGIVT